MYSLILCFLSDKEKILMTDILEKYIDYQSGQTGTAILIIQGTSNGIHVTDSFNVSVCIII